MNEYVVVIAEETSLNGDVIARISQLHIGEVERWRVSSARCHIQPAQSQVRPRLGSAVVYLLGERHPLYVTRSGSRVTICEAEFDGVVMVDQERHIDLPVSRVWAIHEAVLAGLDGRLGSASIV